MKNYQISTSYVEQLNILARGVVRGILVVSYMRVIKSNMVHGLELLLQKVQENHPHQTLTNNVLRILPLTIKKMRNIMKLILTWERLWLKEDWKQMVLQRAILKLKIIREL